MHTRFSHVRRPSTERRPAFCRLMLERLEDRTLLTTGFVETPLVSNIPGLAPNTDRELINPWGFAETSSGQFRVAANGSGQGILFNAQGQKSGADINIPIPAGSPPGATSTPNGVIINTTSDFVISLNGRSAPASLLFSTEDGTIAGWNPALSQSRAVIAADQSGNGAVYKLLTMDQAGGANYLYATNFHNGIVDVFDAHFARHTFFAGQFTDPNAPAGFAPFGIKNVNGTLFVTYAKQDAAKHDDVAGPGNGFIDEFTSDGHFIQRFASGTAAGGTLTALNSPIGATFAPAGFGNFGGDLLIGNFGNSHVSAFNPSTGQFLGQLQDTSGHPLVLTAGITGTGGNTKGLWGIGFGNGQGGAGTQSMFFAAGPNDETDGVFGMVNVASAANNSALKSLAAASNPQPSAASTTSTSTVQPLQVVPSPFISNSELNATAAIADNDIWAIGVSGVNTSAQATLVEHFNGSSWSVIPTPSVAGGSFAKIAGAAGNDVWAIGSQTKGNGTLIEHWNGTSWSVVSGAKVPNGSFLTGVTAVASNDVWAVGIQPGSRIFNSLIEHWNGKSWSVVSSPQIAGQIELKGVSADSANDIWAVGAANGAGLVEHFNGQTWSVVPSPSGGGNVNNKGNGSLNAVTALSPTDVWAVGSVPGPPPTDIASAIEHWDGTSWQFVAPASSVGRGVSIAAVSADNIWAIIGGGTEHWDGTSWSQIATASGVNQLNAVTALSDGTVVAVGQGTNFSAVIVSNRSPAPAAAAAPATQAKTASAPTDLSGATTAQALAAATSDRLDPAAVDQIFGIVGSTVYPSHTRALRG